MDEGVVGSQGAFAAIIWSNKRGRETGSQCPSQPYTLSQSGSRLKSFEASEVFEGEWLRRDIGNEPWWCRKSLWSLWVSAGSKHQGLTGWLHVAAGSLTSAPVSGITGHVCLSSAKVYQHPSTLTLPMSFHIHHSVQFGRSAWISHEVNVCCMLKSRSCLCQILW